MTDWGTVFNYSASGRYYTAYIQRAHTSISFVPMWFLSIWQVGKEQGMPFFSTQTEKLKEAKILAMQYLQITPL